MQLMQPKDYVSEFILTRRTKKSIVMVEGTTDRALWTEYAADDCHLRPAQGKDIIIDVLNTPFVRGMQGIAGIVDADYWLITEAEELGTENLLYDDCCPDIESMLLCSPALKKVLRNTLYNHDVDEIHAFAEKLACKAQGLAMEFGYFRWLNHCRDYGLALNAIRLDEALDFEALSLDCHWIARRLAEGNGTVTSEQLLDEVAELREKCPPESIQLCRGKDVLAVMALILPGMYEARFGHELPSNAKNLSQEGQMAKELRKAYEYMYFRETSLFGCIQTWEAANPRYRILKVQI